MSLHPRSLTMLMTVAVLAAVPAASCAHASSGRSSQPSVAGVQLHVLKAHTAGKRLQKAVRRGAAGTAKKQLRIARTHTAAASQFARRMSAQADSQTEVATATLALTIAAAQYDELIAQITGLVGEAAGTVQMLLASAIVPAVGALDGVTAVVTGLLPRAPSSSQGELASIVVALAVGDADAIVNIGAALDAGGLTAAVSDVLAEALTVCTQSIMTGFTTVAAVVPMISGVVAGALNQIIEAVTSAGAMAPLALGTVTGLVSTVLGALPAVGGAVGVSTDVDVQLGDVLSGILGGHSAGALPAGIGGLLASALG